jgi:subtilase family serine protease
MNPLPKYLIALLFMSGLPVSFAQSNAQDRILQAVDSSASATLRGSEHPLAQPKFDQGRVNPNTTLHGVSLVFKPSAAQQAAIVTLLAEQQQISSVHYHQWLTPEQYAQRFALTSGDVAKVTLWLESQGFKVDRVARSRTQVSFTGSVARLESVFQTEIHNYLVGGEIHFANSTALSLPAALLDVVRGVRNMDDFRPKAMLQKVSPRFTSSITGAHFLAPSDFAAIYDVNALYNLGFDGSGQKIAVVGDSSISLSNIATFRTLSGLPANNPTEILLSGSGVAWVPSADEQTEAYLDLEWSGAIARNATIYYIYVGKNSTSSVWDAIQYAVDQDTAPVISSSFGFCEPVLGQAFADTLQVWAQQANLQGQTIVSASGDAGAADCDSGTAATQGYAVDVPAAIPEVTGIGGTEFTGDAASTGTTTYWNGTNNSDYASALTYIPEGVWNDTVADATLAAGGGGKSVYFAKPAWQTGAGVPSDGKRDVPDISFSASADHDPYLICGANDSAGFPSCTSGFRDSQSYVYAVGGTSVGAPSFAGIMALLNQATLTGQGNVNPTLYTLAASTPGAFHDTTTGDNIVPCTAKSTNCPAATPYQFGYTAGTGYDQASGLGSLDVYNLVTAWPGYIGSYSLATVAATVSSSGSTGTSTVTVTQLGGFAGTVSLTCASANVTVGCSLSPTSVTLSSTTASATSTLTVTTTAASVIPGKATAVRSRQGEIWFSTTGASLVAGFCLVGTPPRKRRWASLLSLVVLGCLLAGVGCGGGSSTSSSSSGTTTSTGTAPGTYVITIAGSSGQLKQSGVVSVTVN